MKFIKYLVIIFVFGFGLQDLNAEKPQFVPETYFGLSFGETASMIYFNPTVKQSFLTGYNGGFIYRYIGKKNLGVQAELNYSQRGWKESDGLYARQLNYIELPFMTHFNFGNHFRTFFNIGPKISYLYSEKTLINESPDSSAEQHISPVENPFDYGFCTGFGFLLNVKGQVLQLEARGNYSISDVFSNAAKDYFDNSNNLNLAVNVTWLFQKK